MKFEQRVVIFFVVMSLAGCVMLPRHKSVRKGMKVRPVEIIKPESPAALETESDRLMKKLKAQEAVIKSMRQKNPAAIETPQAVEAAQKTPVAPPAKPQPRKSPEKEPTTLVIEKQELSVAHLISLLEAKEKRTAAEEEAYRRLLGIARTDRYAAGDEGSPAGRLLDAALDALAEGDVEKAQAKTAEALALLRRETDPSIDRLFFAVKVRNYGNADVIENPVFSPGQVVLAVVDLSNFCCLPVEGGSLPGRYFTKMTLRLAIYDAKGALCWQKADGPREYRAAGYVATMFWPSKFRLPLGLKAGKYTIKAEVIDHLAGRQTQSTAEFTVK